MSVADEIKAKLDIVDYIQRTVPPDAVIKPAARSTTKKLPASWSILILNPGAASARVPKAAT
jgi:hypothetical protein